MIPRVTTTSPLTGATSVPVTSNISIVFNTALKESSVNTMNLLLTRLPVDSSAVPVACAVRWDPTTNTISITPNATLEYTSNYRLIVKGDNLYNDLIKVGVLSINDEPMVGDYIVTFTTEDEIITDPEDDDEDVTDTGLPTIKLAVLSTIPANRSMMYTGTHSFIRFNDNLLIPQSGITVYNVELPTEEAVLYDKLKIYRSSIIGSESAHYIANNMVEVDNYDYTLTDNILDISLINTGTSLPINSRFYITLNPGFSGDSTLPMTEVYQYTFLSQISPLYTTPAMIRFNAGPALNSLSDEYLYTLILSKSIEIHRIFADAGQTLPYYPSDSGSVPEFVSRWVLCSVKLDLFRQIMNNAAINGGTVTLGDLSVSVGDIGKLLMPEINDLQNCVNATTSYIQSYLYSGVSAMVPHLNDGRAPWYDRDGRYRHTWKGEEL